MAGINVGILVLSSSNLVQSKARGVNFSNSNLEFADLSYASFRRSVFLKSNMKNVKY